MTDKETASLASSGYTPARAFSLFSLAVLIGALLASFGIHPAVVLVVALLPLLLRPLCLWPLRVATILSLALLLSFFWAVVRKDNSGPAQNDLYFVHLVGRVHIRGQIEEVRERVREDEPGGEGEGANSTKHDFTLIVRADELLYPTRRPLEGKVLVSIEAAECELLHAPLPGDLVEIAGVLRKPRGKNFSFEFDEATWLASKGIFARLSVKPVDFHIVDEERSKGCPDSLENINRESAFVKVSRAIAVLRKEIVNAHSEHLGVVGGGLFSSMVLGDRVVCVDQELKRQFSLVGLSHLLAASGLNLTIIVTAALVLCRFFQPSVRKSQSTRAHWLTTYIPFLCVVLFTAFAGAGPSVSRAAIMCLVALWARLAFVRLAHGTALALALLFALALDPLSVSDVGLQLSYGATFGIVYIYPLIESAWFKDIASIYLRALYSLVAVVVAAQIAVLPIQLHVFQQLSILVVPANLLAEPVVVPLTIMGFVSSIFAAIASCQLPPAFNFCQPLVDASASLCWAIDWLAKFPLDWLTCLAQSLSRIPLVSLSVAKPQPAHVFLYYLVVALVLLGGRARPRLACLLLCFSFALLAAVSYIESPLLQLLCTNRELIVNRGNFEYFVFPLGRQCSLGRPELPQTSLGKSYVRWLAGKGIHAAKAPLVGDQLILTPEALRIDIGAAKLARSALPIVEVVALSVAHSTSRFGPGSSSEPSSQPNSGSCRLLALPSRRGPEYCRINGEVATPLFVPYCPMAMPMSFPLVAEVEAVKSAYLITLRL
ncbi:MAG: ComEC/Rec2 family competence protein [Candidatus Obscuribacterales bacterium]